MYLQKIILFRIYNKLNTLSKLLYVVVVTKAQIVLLYGLLRCRVWLR